MRKLTGSVNWRNLINFGFPPFPDDFPNKKDVKAIENLPWKYRLPVRSRLGKVWVKKEYNKWRKKILGAPLP